MKKSLTILSLVSMILLSCGTSVNDKAKIQKAILDSIKKSDSLKIAHKLDSLKKDSIAAVQKKSEITINPTTETKEHNIAQNIDGDFTGKWACSKGDGYLTIEKINSNQFSVYDHTYGSGFGSVAFSGTLILSNGKLTGTLNCSRGGGMNYDISFTGSNQTILLKTKEGDNEITTSLLKKVKN